MKTLAMCWLVGVALLTGCISEVQSYDAYGNVIGSCRASHYMVGGSAMCVGSSNPKDQGVVPPVYTSKQEAPKAPYHSVVKPDPTSHAKCPEGQVFQYNQCYPVDPINNK